MIKKAIPYFLKLETSNLEHSIHYPSSLKIKIWIYTCKGEKVLQTYDGQIITHFT